MKVPNIIQIVLGSDNLPLCKHLYTTVFGFAGAGDRLVYGEHNGRVMGFGTHGGAVALYMVGRQELMQRGGTTFLELVHYEHPAGRPRPLDDGLDRQGFKTVAVGHRDPADTGAIFRRVRQAGLDWTVAEPVSHIGGNPVVGAVAHHMKTLSVPHDVERQFGYSPEPQRWWRPPARDAEPQDPNCLRT